MTWYKVLFCMYLGNVAGFVLALFCSWATGAMKKSPKSAFGLLITGVAPVLNIFATSILLEEVINEV